MVCNNFRLTSAHAEPMDLEHFWNVISLHYPEDHSPAWIDFMSSVFSQPDFLDEDEDVLYCLPCLGDMDVRQYTDNLIESKLSTYFD